MSELAFATKEAREINRSVLQGLVQLMTSGVPPGTLSPKPETLDLKTSTLNPEL
jgi:hypothetical protein